MKWTQEGDGDFTRAIIIIFSCEASVMVFFRVGVFKAVSVCLSTFGFVRFLAVLPIDPSLWTLTSFGEGKG